jgi:hypothetical protein
MSMPDSAKIQDNAPQLKMSTGSKRLQSIFGAGASGARFVMSQFGGTFITAIAEALAVPIRKGHPFALLGGAMAGSLVGGLAGLINSLLIGPSGVLGALLGAVVAGILFPRPPCAIAPPDPLTDLDAAEQKHQAALARSARWTPILKLIAGSQFALYLVILGVRLMLVFLEPEGERSVIERQRLQNDIEAVRQAVREGKAGEGTSRLFPDEHQKFLQRKQSEDEPRVP